jgi:hypothetical protein
MQLLVPKLPNNPVYILNDNPKLHLTVDICKTIRDLKTSSGIYVKSACTVYLNYDQSTARSTCRANGMQLYTFNTVADQAVLFAYADSQWPYNELWIEGGNATSCSAISNFNATNFKKISVPCLNNTNYFYCEFKCKLQFNSKLIFSINFL